MKQSPKKGIHTNIRYKCENNIHKYYCPDFWDNKCPHCDEKIITIPSEEIGQSPKDTKEVKISEWEDRFAIEISPVITNPYMEYDSCKGMIRSEECIKKDIKIVKFFISQERLLAQREIEDKIKSQIGLMRQWLNEDRITDKKMVTNEELLYWFKDIIQ